MRWEGMTMTLPKAQAQSLVAPRPTAVVVELPDRRPLTPKMEAFCRAYAETGCASTAYRASYAINEATKAETVHVEACRLLADPKITLRVADIEAEALAATRLTIERLVSEGLSLLDMAKADGDIRAATAVLATLGKLHERLAPAPTGRRSLDDMSDADLQAIAAGGKMNPSGQWLEDLLAKSKQERAAEDKARVAELIENLGYRLPANPEMKAEFPIMQAIEGRSSN
jgi:hypothetical protein